MPPSTAAPDVVEFQSPAALPLSSMASMRLPSVSVPRDAYSPPPGFNPGRRISMSDPFLHAYPAMQETPSASSSEPFLAPIKPNGATSRPGSAAGGAGGAGPRYAGPPAGYEFGSSFAGGGGAGGSSYASHPNPSYRFGAHGGAPPGSAEGGSSYFDYSMRRHSLTNAGQSPPRLPAIDTPPQPSSGGKRKSYGDSIPEEYPYPANAYPSSHLTAGPYPKRRGSGLIYDKQGNLTGRDTGMGGMGAGGWEDDRRGSGGYGGSYAMGGYGAPSMESYDSRAPPPVNYSAFTGQRNSNEGLPYDHIQSNGSRGSVPMGPPGSMQGVDLDFERRTSAPGGGSTTSSTNSSAAGPMPYAGGGQYSNARGGGRSGPSPQQQQQQIPTVHLPPLSQSANPEDPRSHAPPPLPRSAPTVSYSNLPPAQAAWARAGPLPPSAHGHIRPPASSSSLDPSSAYGAGLNKETPYSRSPELRVSHKLAERKRRKEMAQLFDDLRDALPYDRGLKSSKWEILSKAVDYIVKLKAHSVDLATDNTMLRNHFSLGPGPQAPSGLGQSPPGTYPPLPPAAQTAAQDSPGRVPTGLLPPLPDDWAEEGEYEENRGESEEAKDEEDLDE